MRAKSLKPNNIEQVFTMDFNPSFIFSSNRGGGGLHFKQCPKFIKIKNKFPS